MDAIVVVDMQVGLLDGPPKYDLPGVLDRINRLTAGFEPKTPGWAFLPELDRQGTDVVVEKTLNDPFAGTDLKAVLEAIAPDRVLIAGWATDFCVDATVRSSVVWSHLISNRSIRVARAAELLAERGADR